MQSMAMAIHGQFMAVNASALAQTCPQSRPPTCQPRAPPSNLPCTCRTGSNSFTTAPDSATDLPHHVLLCSKRPACHTHAPPQSKHLRACGQRSEVYAQEAAWNG